MYCICWIDSTVFFSAVSSSLKTGFLGVEVTTATLNPLRSQDFTPIIAQGLFPDFGILGIAQIILLSAALILFKF
jgi:hypothetical protein